MFSDRRYGIKDFIKDVLKKRFSDNKIKQTLDDSDSDKLNFACPYCGDSNKDSSKKRGNFYLSSNTYKCFNDGCLVYVKDREFISKFARKYSLDIPSIKEAKLKHRPLKSTRKGHMLEFLMLPKINSSLLNIKDVSERFNLKPCLNAGPSSEVYKYASSRYLMDLPVFRDTCYYDISDSKIHIFNMDISSGKILGMSTRKIVDNSPGPRYDIKNYSDFANKAKLVTGLTDDEIKMLDNINNYFNILNVKFNKPIPVTEGQFDSMFLDNAIATTGVTKSKSLLGTLISTENARIFFDNDKAGKQESMKLIQKDYRVYMWSKFIGDLRKKHYNHIKEINDITDINKLYQFYMKIGSNIKPSEFNEVLSKYYSESQYDAMFI